MADGQPRSHHSHSYSHPRSPTSPHSTNAPSPSYTHSPSHTYSSSHTHTHSHSHSHSHREKGPSGRSSRRGRSSGSGDEGGEKRHSGRRRNKERPHHASRRELSSKLPSQNVPVINANEVELGPLIGSGTYGRVFRGKCRGEEVAVKILDGQRWDAKLVKDFKKEVEIMTSLHHPNVVLLMGACVENGHLDIVTELLENNLQKIVHSNDYKLSDVQRVNFALDIAQGMSWLHGTKPHQIIHRDLKLSNLLVDSNLKVKVADFGLSDFLKADFLQDEGVAIGSALWMSPEVLLGQKLSDKIDVYSFGLVLWELWSRKEPYTQFETIREFREAVCFQNFRPSLKKYNIPPFMQVIIAKCWQTDPTQRPSFVNILDMLKDAIVDTVFGVANAEISMLWKQHDAWRGQQQVNYEALVEGLCSHLSISPKSKRLELNCFKALISQEKIKGVDTTPVVNITRFGLVMQWFGPLHTPPSNLAISSKSTSLKRGGSSKGKKGGDGGEFTSDGGGGGGSGSMHSKGGGKGKTVYFFDRILRVMRHGWFFGDLEREEAENLLRDFKKKVGTFLVRVNLGGSLEPSVSPFTISKVNKVQKVEHQRVYRLKNNGGFYVQIKTKTGSRQVSVMGDLAQLISKLKKKGILRKDGGVPGQKYKRLFEEDEDQAAISIYLEADSYVGDNIGSATTDTEDSLSS